MGYFYIQVEKDIWEMDSTSSVAKTMTGTLSSSRVEDGSVSSDNYVINPVVLSFDGIISDIKSASSQPPNQEETSPKLTRQYLAELEDLYRNKTPLKAAFNAQSPELEDCFFTTFKVSQDSAHGSRAVGDVVRSSYRVAFTLQQVRFGETARIVAAPSEAVDDAMSAQEDKNSSTLNPCAGLGAGEKLCELTLEAQINDTGG
jgi:hypothetical protein